MNWLDFLFIAILIASVVAGAMKGLARAAIGLAALVLGIVFACRWYAEAGMFLRGYVSSHALANGIGFLLVLLGFSIAGAIVSAILAMIFKWVGLSWLDRLLGAAFGVVRAAVIAVALVLVGTAFPQSGFPDAIAHSRYAPYVMDAAKTLTAIAPDELKDAFQRNYQEVQKVWGDMMQRKKKLPETSF